MLKIGLCGSSGSGKGYVCKKFKEYGVSCIDTDKVYMELVTPDSPCIKELCRFFGTGILNADGSLDKKRLSERVFEGDNASQHLKVLNTITHRYIKADVEKTLCALETDGVRAVIIDAPVLFESRFNEMCDTTVCITAPEELKISRVVKRDKIPTKKAIARIQSQLPDERLRELCDHEIINDDRHDLDAQITQLVKNLGLDL